MITNLIRENRKTLSIIINKNGEMQVKAPRYLPLNEILKFVQSKEKWILNKQNQVKNSLETNKDIIGYKKILYLGNKIDIIYLNNIKEIQFDNNKIIMPEKWIDKGEKKIANWLKTRTLQIIENRVLYFASNYNLSFETISFINSKNRWGTCSTCKELCFNWRLVMLSPKLIDYVIIHELSHTLEPNHSLNFWKVVATIMPDYKERRAELKKCGFVLNLFR